MTDTEIIITKTKEYILNLYSEGLSTHQNMILGLKNGIDYFVGQSIGDVERIKDEIIFICLQEFELQTKVYNKPGHLKKIETIKSEFESFVRNLTPTAITEITPMPFERRINSEETDRLNKSLKEKFDFDVWKSNNYYWEPLAKTENTVPLIYFKHDLFKTKEVESIRAIVSSISGNRIYLLTEEKLNYEVETSTLDFDWMEAAYCDFKTNWLIYISHEGTITFSGQPLISEFEISLPQIMKYKNLFE